MSFTETVFWTQIHGLIAILCANLPVYKPLRTKISNLFAMIQRSFGSSFRSSRGDTRERVDDSEECLEPSFHLRPTRSNPPRDTHTRIDNYLEEGRHPILNRCGGANPSMVDRSDVSVDPYIVSPRGALPMRG